MSAAVFMEISIISMTSFATGYYLSVLFAKHDCPVFFLLALVKSLRRYYNRVAQLNGLSLLGTDRFIVSCFVAVIRVYIVFWVSKNNWELTVREKEKLDFLYQHYPDIEPSGYKRKHSGRRGRRQR